MAIRYSIDFQLESEQFIDLLRRSTLAERRPVDDEPRIREMLTNADVLVTAHWTDDAVVGDAVVGDSEPLGKLVGVSRAITDHAYCTYLSDLAVDADHQGQGIGRELIRRTHEVAGYQTRLILLSAPAAESYYPHVGMQPHHSCWMIPPRDEG
ncbi:GNAT family N-acetyltransferase [Rhodopirellula sp. P2]|uniref:GNAT family N-acetyltransferase n=1 Tax=Rhodopirellula sp. P2 TaxID=2127060 RepID=UPI002367DE5B|nr:GNAT family N-acetyltransferase [Rhodopirellula sp. P2]WDQ17282.1 GNAT family N-acetyltransferase [Rhodopirellula sp. P2]